MPGGRRSPVDQALRELASVYRHLGADRQVSLDEAIHVAQALSRRDFLRLGGLAGGGLALAGCTSSSTGSQPTPTATATSSDGDSPSVVVIGAGLAGMTVAYRLHQAGVSTRVFESRDRVGGRCWSARDFEGGQVGEHGGEFIDTRHVHMSILANELQLELDDLWSAWVPGSTWLEFVDGEIVKGRELLVDMRPAIQRLVKFSRTHGRGIAPGASAAMKQFDELSMADWYKQEVGSPDSASYRLWSSSQTGWWGLDPDGLGAGNVIDFYATDYPGGNERYTVHGGNDQVPIRILELLPEGTVTLETPLEAVRRSSDGTYSLRFGGVAAEVKAERVVFTLPFTALREVDLSDAGFTPARMRQIEELGMGTGSKLLMQFDQPFPMGDWSGGMQRGDDPQFGTWESGATDSGAKRYGLLTVFSGGRAGAGYDAETAHADASQAVVDSNLAAIDQVVPGTSTSFNGRAWLDSWVQDPWVHGSYAAFLPTQMTTMFGVLGASDEAAHFAGEHTSAYSQGFLNGGVESGSRASAEVLKALGKPLPPGLVKSFNAQRRYEPIYPWASDSGR